MYSARENVVLKRNQIKVLVVHVAAEVARLGV